MLDVVTTSARANPALRERAAALASRFGWRVVAPQDAPADCVVVTRVGLRLRVGGRDHRWHPGMLHALEDAGSKHPIIRMTGLKPGDTVIDCTLGLGTEAAFCAGWTGVEVLAFESVPAIAIWAQEGLAGRGVRVRIGDALDGLAAMADRCADVVMADPLFEVGGAGHGLAAVRAAGERGLDAERWLTQALRVARRAVLLKDGVTEGDGLLERLGAPAVAARRGRRARWGCWRLDADGETGGSSAVARSAGTT